MKSESKILQRCFGGVFMGKQVKRVPINFDWPINKTWWGYELREVVCQTCAGMGRLVQLPTVDLIQKGEIQRIHDPERCPTCDGKGRIHPIIEIPRGTGYQLWDTTHNWSRSEEHTSELQSRENLVCRLLLE